MKHVSFEEYEAAKAEIIGGVHYVEKSTMENNVIHKTYSTEENGTFYEVNDKAASSFGATSIPKAGFTTKTSGPPKRTKRRGRATAICWRRESERTPTRRS